VLGGAVVVSPGEFRSGGEILSEILTPFHEKTVMLELGFDGTRKSLAQNKLSHMGAPQE